MGTLYKKKDYEHRGDYKYVKLLINKLLNDENVPLGHNGEGGVFSGKDLTNDQKKALQNILDDVYDTTVEDFNKVVKDSGLKWQKIFKGTFSGYIKGLSSKNKGNEFEDIFIKRFKFYEPEIKNIIKYEDDDPDLEKEGQKNNKRPLKVENDKVFFGNSATDLNIGKTITDVTINTKDKGKIYISLKYGDTVTFVNAGIKKYLTKEFLKEDKPLNDQCQTLLDLLCLDKNRVQEVFNTYGGKRVRKSNKDKVDITDKLKNNEIFDTFIKSAIGYGYILIHQNGKDVHYINLMNSNDLKSLINNLNDAYIEYPKNGEAKRIDIFVKYDKIQIKLNIRAKDGGIYPTHIMADYKFIK